MRAACGTHFSHREKQKTMPLFATLQRGAFLATRTRLELVTSSVTGWRSNQLSYWAVATKHTLSHNA